MASCDCNTCEPSLKEPYFTIQFFSAIDSTKKIVVIDTVNAIWGKDIRYYQDTTSRYRFPLSMHDDITELKLVYRDTTNYNVSIVNNITINYQREITKLNDNNILVKCYWNNYEADFKSHYSYCQDTTAIQCLSNARVIKAYL